MSQQVMPTVYPVTTDTGSFSNHSSSNGSYGSVFIVLAVIVTVSALACFFGRLCNKHQNVAKPSTKENNDRKRNFNGPTFQGKDGPDIEFGYDKRFASAKVGTSSNNEPTMARRDHFGESNMVRPNSFRDHPTTDRPSSIREPTLGQSRSNSFHKTNKVQPSSFDEPGSMGRPAASSFHEPTTMGQSNLFHGQSQGDQMRSAGHDDRDNNGINFKIRTRAQLY